MERPPETLDGAVVLYWATSEEQPFFEMPIVNPEPGGAASIPIHGLAICRYLKGSVYLFSCDASWEVINDSDWDTVEDAMSARSAQYDKSKVTWRKALTSSGLHAGTGHR